MPGNKISIRATIKEWSIKPCWQRHPALPILLMAISLMGCSTERIKYVPAPTVPLPASLTADCIPPLPDLPLTYGGSIIWNDQLLETIENCNLDKKAIREIEANREEN